MYEEPYRWVEAVGNRRRYLDEQFKQGSPVVALSYADGVLLVTVSRGTPKLYEIYDRIGLGGMGHPADLEKLRFSLLELAHVEGFNRSPSDVTASRLMRYGLAPAIKQAFEEVYKAPFIVKILLAELGTTPGRDVFLTVNYDGAFEETTGYAVLAATSAVQAEMAGYLKKAHGLPSASLSQAISAAVKAWAIGSLAQGREQADEDKEDAKDSLTWFHQDSPPDEQTLAAHIRETIGEKTLECAVLERRAPGSSKYRALRQGEVLHLLPAELKKDVVDR